MNEDNFNIEKAIKEQVILERKKREEREKMAQRVRKEMERQEEQE